MPTYLSIDSPSVNWCAIHAMATALYIEQGLQNNTESSQLHYFFKPRSQRAALQPLSAELLGAIGYSEAQAAQILAAPNQNNIGALSILRYRAQQEVIHQIQLYFQALGLSAEEQQPIIAEHSDTIAILREIIVFFDKNRQLADHSGTLNIISSQQIQNELSPLIFSLYAKLAHQPELQDQQEHRRLFLNALIGPRATPVFLSNVWSQELVPIVGAQQGAHSYQQDLVARFNLTHEHQRAQNALLPAFPVPGQAEGIEIPLEPGQQNQLHRNMFQFSADMLRDMTQLFFDTEHQPDINPHDFGVIHDFDLFGSDKRYVFKGQNRHLKLLVACDDNNEALLNTAATAQRFNEATGFETVRAPHGWQYFFGTISSTLMTIGSLFLGIMGLYGLYRLFTTARPSLPPQPTSRHNSLPQARGVLQPPRRQRHPLQFSQRRATAASPSLRASR